MMKRAPLEDIRTPRQKQFIVVAARLFSERGYHSVGINEISAELGLSGPAIYRHYPSKEALLVAVLNETITSHLEEVRNLVSSITDDRETLDAIIQDHVDFVFNQSAHFITWRTEFRSLPDADRHRLRYLQRLYTEEWVRTVGRLRPELDDARVRAMCDAAIALIQSPTEYHSPLPREHLAPLLAQMATQALLCTSVATEVVAPARAQANGGRRTGASVKAEKVVPPGKVVRTATKKPATKRTRVASA
jgi:AcrR family transcriptional regulator